MELQYGLGYADWLASHSNTRWVYPLRTRPLVRGRRGDVIGCLSIDSSTDISSETLNEVEADHLLNGMVANVETFFSDALQSHENDEVM